MVVCMYMDGGVARVKSRDMLTVRVKWLERVELNTTITTTTTTVLISDSHHGG